eukprot:CAMPEP_0168537556 /NCGR_PEP_ID=MMETSP0405-20121227/20442_1 /TAXON_ID=498012 /ORGANISM="Trichosphaerium sp, Strain Am-I-7 wt" /LENGTH=573 /DNA_ID=CAMNT_0008566229 /DNA_START=66 /DNA_END=1784 /DNA_ORIENTATION=+
MERCHGMKPQLKILFSYNIEVKNLSDPKIAAWMIDSDVNKDNTLSQMYKTYVNKIPTTNVAKQHEYSIVKAIESYAVMAHLEKRWNTKEEAELYRTIEMPILEILSRMEYLGIGFDDNKYTTIRRNLEAKIANLERRAYAIAGMEFNIGTPDDVSYVLWEKLGIEYPKGYVKRPQAKMRRVQKSTNKEVLMAIRHKSKLPNIILEWRKLSHTINTYIDSLPKFAFPRRSMQMKRVYSTCLQTACPTGRLAFTDPNLQSITHSFDFVPVKGTKTSQSSSSSKSPDMFHSPTNSSSPTSPALTPLGPVIRINIRDSFCSQKGFQLISADYSQLEFRILAHYAQDEKLNSTFHTKDDIFKNVASIWLNKNPNTITKEERSHCKHIVYGILYGMGIGKLAKDLNTTYDNAKKLKKEFKDRYPGVKRFLHRVITECKDCAYVETLLGRRRYLRNIYASNESDKQQAKRQAINTLCQGSAADIVKKAMINVMKRFNALKLKTRLLLQIHDELVFEVPNEEMSIAIVEIKREMERVVSLRVPLPVKIETGVSWGSLIPTVVDTPENRLSQSPIKQFSKWI